MQSFESVADARKAITTFLIQNSADLDEEIRDKIMDLGNSPSPVDQVVRTAEYLYARQGEIGVDGRDLAGALAAFAALNGWHGLADDNRGGRIAQAMRRENEEEAPPGVTFPDPETDPEVKSEYAPPAPVVDPAPIPPGTPAPTPAPSPTPTPSSGGEE